METTTSARIKKISSYCNALANDVLFDEIVDAILDESNIRVTIRDTSKFTLINKILFGTRYESGTFRVGEFQAENRKYAKDTILFRSRNVSDKKDSYTYADFWEPPACYISQGRLNKANEQMLYVSCYDPETAILESRSDTGDSFILSFYRTVEELELTAVGFHHKDAINTFLSTHFSKNGSGVYSISEKLAKHLYAMGDDGWIYPSVLKSSGVNVCLNLSSKHKLELLGVRLYQRGAENFELSGIFSLEDKNSVRLLNDWDEPNGSAHSKRLELEKLIKSYGESHMVHHSKQVPNQEPAVKVIILPEKS